MISFKNVPLEPDEHYLFLIPEPLKNEVIDYMREAGIACTGRNWNTFVENRRDPYSVLPEYKEEIAAARERFEKKGYCNTTCIGAIESQVKPDILFEKCLEFFGDTIDPDYEQRKAEQEAKSQEAYETSYKNWLQEGQIPVDSGK